MERIVYTAADVNYRLQAEVLLASLVATQTSPTKLIVFGASWTASDIDSLKKSGGGCVTVDVIAVDPLRYPSIRLTNGFPLATVYNILAPKEELPSGSRALYVDADVVVRKNLDTLFELKLEHPVGAVIDAHIAVMGIPSMWRPWREEGVDPLVPYLNTGVLLIDVDLWRRHSVTEQIIELLEKYDLPCVDQDAINLVLKGRFDRLSPAYNSMPYHLMKLLRNSDLLEREDELREAIVDPSIIHFHRSFLGKPWARGATHPARHLWVELADQVRPGWRKTTDLVGFARGFAAQKAKMSTLDERALSMSKLRIERVSS